MPTKKIPAEGPTRRTVEEFFRSVRLPDPFYDESIRLLDKEIDIQQKKILAANPKYMALWKKRDRIERQLLLKKGTLSREINRVRNMYRCVGLTPAVVTALKQLVDKVNKAHTKAD